MNSVPLAFPIGLQIEFINPIFEFSKGMNDLHLDEAEYALLIAINIFSAGQPPMQWRVCTHFAYTANCGQLFALGHLQIV